MAHGSGVVTATKLMPFAGITFLWFIGVVLALSVPLYDDHGGSLRHFGCRRRFGLRAFVGTTNVATYGDAAGEGPRRTERRGAS